MSLLLALYILWGVVLRTSLSIPAPAEPAPSDDAIDPKDK